LAWLHIIISIPFLLALVVSLLYKQFIDRIHTGWFVLGVPISIFLYLLIVYLPAISQGDTLISTLAWIPSLDINLVFYVDGLSLTFGLIITGIGALVTLYSIFYLSKEREALNNFYVYLLLFIGSMLGLVFSDNIFVLYVFWELTTIASFLLIAFWFEREKSRYGALKSLVITILGGLSMLAGFIMLAIVADTYSIRAMMASVDLISGHSLFIPAMFLILLGAFTKSAQFPFSIWLPDAMEALITGGTPMRLKYRKRVISKPELVLLCDVSGSVALFSDFMLQLVYTIQNRFSYVRSFLFVNTIDEVTEDLKNKNIQEGLESAFAKARYAMSPFSDYGRVFCEFEEKYLTGISPQSTLLILGDARNNYNHDEKEHLQKIQEHVRRVLWFNPQPKKHWDAEDSIISIYATYCRQVFECRNLKQLEEAIEAIL
jgi:MFS family permease